MVTIGDKARDILNGVAALLWCFLVFASWFGAKNPDLVYAGLIASSVIIVIYYLQGAVIGEKIAYSTIIYPVLLNAVLWIIAFSMACFTKGQKCEFILGVHPGFFGALVFFWLGTFVCTALAYALLFDKAYLPEEKWNDFMKEVHQYQKLR